MICLLYSNDNYLQTYSNIELYRFRNFTAYLKLLYAIRKNSTRKFILKAYLLKFSELIQDFIPIKTLSLKRCILRKITSGDNYPLTYVKRSLRLWKQISWLTRPNSVNFRINQLLVDKDKKNLQIIFILFSILKRTKNICFNRIQRYLIIKEEKSFLKEMNEDIGSINTVLNYKNNIISQDKITQATSILQLENLYTNVYGKMRENLTKEIKCNFYLISSIQKHKYNERIFQYTSKAICR